MTFETPTNGFKAESDLRSVNTVYIDYLTLYVEWKSLPECDI